MHIQINTDHNIQGREALAGRLTGLVAKSLDRVVDGAGAPMAAPELPEG